MNLINEISGNLAEMLIVVEGAVSLYERCPKDVDSNAFALIGEALYILRERIGDCLTTCQKSGKTV